MSATTNPTAGPAQAKAATSDTAPTTPSERQAALIQTKATASDALPADFNPLSLNNQLCFPLYATSRAVTKRYTPLLKELGLTYTQYLVMMVLWECEATTVHDLGERLYLDSGTLTPLLKKMEAKGLLTRTRATDDERKVIVRITQQGQELRERALSVPGQIGKCVNLPLNDALELRRLLAEIMSNLQEEGSK